MMATLAPTGIGIRCKACDKPLPLIGGALPAGCVYCGSEFTDVQAEPAFPDRQPTVVEPQSGKVHSSDSQSTAPPLGQSPAEPSISNENSPSEHETATKNKSGVIEFRKRRQSGIWVLAVGGALIAGLIGWDRFSSASQPSGTSIQLDSEWQTITLSGGTRSLVADGPFRLRINGDLFVVPEGAGIAVPAPGLHDRLEARAAERPVTVEVFY